MNSFAPCLPLAGGLPGALWLRKYSLNLGKALQTPTVPISHPSFGDKIIWGTLKNYISENSSLPIKCSTSVKTCYHHHHYLRNVDFFFPT